MKKLFVLVAAAVVMTPLVVAEAAEKPPKAFNQCKACHKVVAGKNGVGPSLFGIFGAKSGMVAKYRYSKPHLAANLTWDEPTLVEYLTNPKKMVPGNKMAFAGVRKPGDMEIIIEYLKTLK